jgi:serine/threonine-protein kinase
MIGEYQVEKKIGEGGFGSVYSAMHPVIGKSAAIKVLHQEFSSNQQIVSRFIEEARAVNQINHRNIIDIFSFGTLPDGRQYYVMELLEGQPLDAFFAEHGALTPPQVVGLLGGVAKALDAAHKRGIVHRDLKPENIFLARDADGEIFPKLLDFGIAKLMTGATGHKTRTGVQIGTPYYMSPEQCRGDTLDHRSDIYSFGVMMHQLLTGRLLFEAETAIGVMMRHVQDLPPSASTVRAGLSPSLDPALLRMLAKDPADRPDSAGEAFDEFSQLVQRHVPGSRTLVDLGRAKTLGLSAPVDFDVKPLATAAGTAPGVSARGGKLWWALAGVGGLVAVAAVVLQVQSGATAQLVGVEDEGESAGDADVIERENAASAQLEARYTEPADVAPQKAVPAPQAIEVTIQSVPPNAIVLRGDVRLGVAPGPFKLDQSDAEVELVVRAPGYADQTLTVTPAESSIAKVKLQPEPRGKSGSAAEPATPKGATPKGAAPKAAAPPPAAPRSAAPKLPSGELEF